MLILISKVSTTEIGAGPANQRDTEASICRHSFCNRCSSKQVAVPNYETENPARVCDPCNDTILADTPGPSGWSPGSGLTDEHVLKDMSQVCAANYNQDIANGTKWSRLLQNVLNGIVHPI